MVQNNLSLSHNVQTAQQWIKSQAKHVTEAQQVVSKMESPTKKAQQELIDPTNPVLSAGFQGFVMDFSLVQQINKSERPELIEKVISAYESGKSHR